MKIKLKYWRERRAMSIRDLSKAAGVSSSTIVEAEKTGDAPRPNALKKLRDALEVTLDELIDDDQAEETPPAPEPGQDLKAAVIKYSS